MRFEPYLHKWLQAKPADVDFVKVPVVPDPPTKTESAFVNQAKAYYALEGMGQLGRLSDEFFRAMVDERQRMVDEQAITKFVARFGVDAEAFRQAFNSFEVDSKLRRAYQLAKEYQINSWPKMVVAGATRAARWRATSRWRISPASSSSRPVVCASPRADSGAVRALADSDMPPRRLRLLSYNIQAGVDTRRYRQYVTHSWKQLLPHRERINNLNRISAVLRRTTWSDCRRSMPAACAAASSTRPSTWPTGRGSPLVPAGQPQHRRPRPALQRAAQPHPPLAARRVQAPGAARPRRDHRRLRAQRLGAARLHRPPRARPAVAAPPARIPLRPAGRVRAHGGHG